MKIRLLGCGGAFEPQAGNSSFWVEDFHGERLLIDCGFTIYPRLVELGLDKAPDALLITHLHADHSGSLSNEILSLWYHKEQKPVRVYLPAEHFRKPLMDFLRPQLLTPETFVDLVPMPPDKCIIAIDTFGEHLPDMPTFGYVLQDETGAVVISGDIANGTSIFKAIESLNLKPRYVMHELTYNPDNCAHVHFKKLEPMLDRYQIYGYHCDPAKKPADCAIPLAWDNPEFRF
ncbi:MAG: MBL fold metallo-hydrolase [Chthoniobacterales bacterium]